MLLEASSPPVHDPRPATNVVPLRGRLDAHRVEDLVATIDRAMSRAADGDVHVDLADVRFLDGHAIEALRSRRARLRTHGRDLRISSASVAVTVILEMARAAGILDHDDLVPGLGIGTMEVAA